MKQGEPSSTPKKEPTETATSDAGDQPARELGSSSSNSLSPGVLKLALDAVGVGVVITDPSRKGNPIIYHNQEFEKMTGYSKEEVTGRNCRFLQGNDSSVQTINEIRKAIREQSSFKGPILNYHKDGTASWNMLTITPVCDQEGRATHFIGVQSDITQRIKNEQALKEQSEALQRFNQKFTLAQSAAQFGIWDWNIRDNELNWDEQMFRLYGMEPGKFKGIYEAWRETVHPGDKERAEGLLQEAIEGNGEFNTQFKVILPSGELRHIQSMARVFWDNSGKPIRMLGTNWDISELTTALEELEKSQKNYHDLYHDTPAMMYSTNEKGRIISVSKFWLQKMGYNRDEVHDKQFTEFLTDGAGKYAKEAMLTQFLETGYSYNVPCQFVTKPGEIIDTLLSAISEKDQAGAIIRSLFVITDITKEKQAEKKLLESQQKFKGIFDNVKDLVCLHLPDGTYQEVSPSIKAIAGYEMHELISKDPYHFFHPEDRDRIKKESHERFLRGEKDIPGIKYRFRHKKGYYVWFQTQTQVVKNAQGEVTQLITSSKDLTEEIESKNKLQELLNQEVAERTAELKASRDRLRQLSDEILNQKNLLEAVINNTSSVIFLKDLEGKYIMVNEQYKKVFHLKKVTGKTDHDIFPTDVADKLAQSDQEVVREKKLLEQEEQVPQDGEMHTYLSVKFPLFDNDGKIFSICGISTDITHEKRQQEKLKEQANELKQFAYLASHDLQEPLRIITSYMQLLEADYTDELGDDGKNYVERSVKAARRMKDLINGLLSYSRITSEAHAFKPTNLGEVMQHVLENLEITIHETQAEIQCEPLPIVAADPVQVGQLFQNLIGNAIKYQSPGQAPKISINVTRERDAYQFCVTDNGIGIDPGFQGRIFEIFQRLHTKKQYSGTGIGLAICKRIVERHGGEIWVESTPGKGSKFFFTLRKQIFT